MLEKNPQVHLHTAASISPEYLPQSLPLHTPPDSFLASNLHKRRVFEVGGGQGLFTSVTVLQTLF